jgi:hypothetical protein
LVHGTRSLYRAGSLVTVSKALSKCKLNLVGLQEVSGIKPAGKYMFLYGKGNEDHGLGTDFLFCIRESYQQLRRLFIILRGHWCHIHPPSSGAESKQALLASCFCWFLVCLIQPRRWKQYILLKCKWMCIMLHSMNIPEDSSLHHQCCESLKYDTDDKVALMLNFLPSYVRGSNQYCPF